MRRALVVEWLRVLPAWRPRSFREAHALRRRIVERAASLDEIRFDDDEAGRRQWQFAWLSGDLLGDPELPISNLHRLLDSIASVQEMLAVDTLRHEGAEWAADDFWRDLLRRNQEEPALRPEVVAAVRQKLFDYLAAPADAEPQITWQYGAICGLAELRDPMVVAALERYEASAQSPLLAKLARWAIDSTATSG